MQGPNEYELSMVRLEDLLEKAFSYAHEGDVQTTAKSLARVVDAVQRNCHDFVVMAESVAATNVQTFEQDAEAFGAVKEAFERTFNTTLEEALTLQQPA